MIDLSIVFPTANRLVYLVKCVESCRAHLGGLTHEFVIGPIGASERVIHYPRVGRSTAPSERAYQCPACCEWAVHRLSSSRLIHPSIPAR